jgi:hypothetical protein
MELGNVDWSFELATDDAGASPIIKSIFVFNSGRKDMQTKNIAHPIEWPLLDEKYLLLVSEY